MPVDPSRWYCQHGHTGLEHPVCWATYKPQVIGCLDVETSNLQADFAILYSWAIKRLDSDVLESSCLKAEDFLNKTYIYYSNHVNFTNFTC